jgi:hypothetical protein
MSAAHKTDVVDESGRVATRTAFDHRGGHLADLESSRLEDFGAENAMRKTDDILV